MQEMILVMDSFGDVLRVLARLKSDGVVEDYAIGGAMAVSFWTEPVATQDLDPLRGVFDWLATQGFKLDGEHSLIAGVPVQFLVAWNPLVEAAVAHAQDVSYDPDQPDSPMVRLIPPTYLVAIWRTDPGADTPRRRERAAMLQEAGLVDDTLLAALLSNREL